MHCVKAPATSKEIIDLDIEGLKPCPQIPRLKEVSGIGTYSSSINLPASWKTGTGARLDLGEVFDSFRLSVIHGVPLLSVCLHVYAATRVARKYPSPHRPLLSRALTTMSS